MLTTPEPVWPVLVLAVIQLGDAAMCLRPLPFIRQCLIDVRFPERYWRLLTPLKLAAAAGLIAGIWILLLGLVTCVALIAYFVVAITMHVRARHFGRNLFGNASAMLLICLAVTYLSFFRSA